jgi:hypothetical protein
MHHPNTYRIPVHQTFKNEAELERMIVDGPWKVVDTYGNVATFYSEMSNVLNQQWPSQRLRILFADAYARTQLGNYLGRINTAYYAAAQGAGAAPTLTVASAAGIERVYVILSRDPNTTIEVWGWWTSQAYADYYGDNGDFPPPPPVPPQWGNPAGWYNTRARGH